MAKSYDVVVVGSCMIDLVCYAPRLPKSGETLCGTNFMMGFGGKGSNQCVAAKKLGADSLLVARVGNDSFGNNYLKKLKEYNISTKYVNVTDGVSSGMAQITVADSGENSIVIVPGANSKLSEEDIINASDAIINSKVLICQLEIQNSSTIKALEIKAKSNQGKSIFNAAPAQSNLHPLLYTLPDIFCANESEAEILTGITVSNPEEGKCAIKNLLAKGCKGVIITLGEQGAVYGESGSDEFIYAKAPSVNAIDTTGAGDAFMGALAFYLSTQPEMSMKEIIKNANFLAAISVQRRGTQESFPTFSELPSK